MFGKVTPEMVIKFTKTCLKVGGCFLPSDEDEPNFETIIRRLYWWFGLIISLSFSLPIIYDLYLNINDLDSIMINMAELCPICTGTTKMLLCKYYRKQLKARFSEMEAFVRTANSRERELLQRYVDRCIPIHYFMLLSIVCTIFGFSSVPVFLPQPYPTHATYPFEVNTEMLKNALRGLQIIGIVQTALFVTIDAVFSALIWFAGVQFELLSETLRSVSDTTQLCLCIKKHHELLRYGEDINLLTRFVVGGVGISTALGTICGGIQLLQEGATMMVKARFVSFVVVGCLELFLYAWPAENLMETSETIGYSAYSSQWIGQEPQMTKLILVMMHRASKPACISVSGFIPTLSLDFYKSFLSTSFSYFTTLRATTTANVQ